MKHFARHCCSVCTSVTPWWLNKPTNIWSHWGRNSEPDKVHSSMTWIKTVNMCCSTFNLMTLKQPTECTDLLNVWRDCLELFSATSSKLWVCVRWNHPYTSWQALSHWMAYFSQAVVELGCGKAPNIKIKQLFLKTWNMDLRSDHSLCERSSVLSLSNIRTLSSSTVSCSNMTGSGGVGCDWFFFCNGILHVQNKRKLIPLTKSTCFKVTSITVQSKKKENICLV